MKKINTENLLRDWRYAVGAIILFFIATFSINYIGVSADFAEINAEAQAAGNTVELPSTFKEALARSLGVLHSILGLFHIVVIVGVGSLLAFQVMLRAFPSTLAKIGEQFDKGWNSMKPAEKTRWQILVWLTLVAAIVWGR